MPKVIEFDCVLQIYLNFLFLFVSLNSIPSVLYLFLTQPTMQFQLLGSLPLLLLVKMSINGLDYLLKESIPRTPDGDSMPS